MRSVFSKTLMMIVSGMRAKYFLSLVTSLCFVCGIFAIEVLECGLGKSEYEGFVFGGQPAAKGAWPWLVALIHRKHEKFFCGGSLISAKHVLSGKVAIRENIFHLVTNSNSAAHCFQGKGNPEVLSPFLVKALVGKHNLSIENEAGSKGHLVRDIVIHHEWKYDQEKYIADIAILELHDAADLNTFVRTVCLPQQSHNSVTGTGMVVGWGKSEYSNGPNEATPLELQEPAIDDGTCYTTFYKLAIYSSSPQMFCGGFANQRKAACTGDSGGGFYFPEGRIWTVRGIVSGGLKTVYGCEVNAYTLYTKIAIFRDWITNVMNSTIDWLKVDFRCEFLDG